MQKWIWLKTFFLYQILHPFLCKKVNIQYSILCSDKVITYLFIHKPLVSQSSNKLEEVKWWIKMLSIVDHTSFIWTFWVSVLTCLTVRFSLNEMFDSVVPRSISPIIISYVLDAVNEHLLCYRLVLFAFLVNHLRMQQNISAIKTTSSDRFCILYFLLKQHFTQWQLYGWFWNA